MRRIRKTIETVTISYKDPLGKEYEVDVRGPVRDNAEASRRLMQYGIYNVIVTGYTSRTDTYVMDVETFVANATHIDSNDNN